MPWHHIIPKHEWKRRFGNLRGFNVWDNKVNFTTEQHIETHKRYWDDPPPPHYVQRTGDKIAYQAISGEIGREEIQRELSRLGGLLGGRPKGIPHTKEWKKDISERMKGHKYLVGHVQSEATKEKHRITMLGNKHLLGHQHTNKSKLMISNTLKNLPRVSCPYCSKVGGPSAMKRYHLNNCKNKRII